MRVPSIYEREPVDPKDLECSREGCHEPYVFLGMCGKHALESIKRFEEESSKVNIIVGVA